MSIVPPDAQLGDNHLRHGHRCPPLGVEGHLNKIHLGVIDRISHIPQRIDAVPDGADAGQILSQQLPQLLLYVDGGGRGGEWGAARRCQSMGRRQCDCCCC